MKFWGSKEQIEKLRNAGIEVRELKGYDYVIVVATRKKIKEILGE